MSMRPEALRRYPALSYLVGACALALLLPSGLTLPQSGPSTLAELAPVPGQGQGPGDLSELAAAASNGLGSGAGAGGGGATTTSVLDEGDDGSSGESGRLVRRPGSKNCVGNPPRQTEDPLSPPCVAFFEGDNGGATAKGVTKDAVTVLVEMSQSSTDPRAGSVVDCSEPPTSDDTFQDIACKAFHRYFNTRYQTYNRVVRLHAVHPGLEVAELDDRYTPFAHVRVSTPETRWADRQTLAVGYRGDSRTGYQRRAPYVVTFRADIEDQIAQVGSYICLKLAGRQARYAGTPDLQSQVRKFGFLSTGDGREQRIRSDVRSRCGVDIDVASDDWDSPGGMAHFTTSGVTTVIVLSNTTGHTTATNYATELGYFPEWFVPGSADLNGLEVNFHGRTANQLQWANAFGVAFDYRRGAINEQPWYRAYREGCGTADCPEPQIGQQGTLFVASAYDALTMLFYAIQAAGPRLTVDNVDRGMHAIEPRASTDPYQPAAYFAPGNYSFIKDAMAISWDPTGTAPGSANRGCWRLPNEGRRFRAGEWRAGDGDVKDAGPCQGDTF